jgi:hypothetical protein
VKSWLLSLSIALFALGLAAALAAPALRRSWNERRTAAAGHELREIAAAFQAHAHARGDWPPADALPGAAPTGMAERLASTRWSQRTPLGGRYTWTLNSVHQGDRYQAALLLVPTAGAPLSAGRDELIAVDRAVDDGNLATGKFRLGFRNYPVFVLEH